MSGEEILARIAVVCDSPQHSRGRTRKMATLTFYADGQWSLDHADRLKRYANLTAKAQGRQHLRSERLTTLFGNDPVLCKLCRRPLPSNAEIDKVAATLAAFGASTITLSQLCVIVRP
jgi:hypothetical protein